MKLRLETLQAEKLEIFKELLGSKDFGGCFCAVWTSHGEDWVTRCNDKSQPNFAITKRNVEDGRHVGYFIYEGDNLIGWTGSGPKTAFTFLKTKIGSRLSAFSDEIWSVGCLAVKEQFRGKGYSDLIIQAVMEEARANGAMTLEAYPTRPFHEPRVFRGTYKLYERLGFVDVGSEKDGDYEIVLMNLPLSGSAPELRRI